jgi:hypothetical protein
MEEVLLASALEVMRLNFAQEALGDHPRFREVDDPVVALPKHSHHPTHVFDARSPVLPIAATTASSISD